MLSTKSNTKYLPLPISRPMEPIISDLPPINSITLLQYLAKDILDPSHNLPYTDLIITLHCLVKKISNSSLDYKSHYFYKLFSKKYLSLIL